MRYYDSIEVQQFQRDITMSMSYHASNKVTQSLIVTTILMIYHIPNELPHFQWATTFPM